ncbi:MAG: hypothetical protein QOG85_598 [Gaiellaceae bacterium]|jgi:hypothetical protein|nr:hypothetical protein [Gaiellaceae bacterium]
MRRLVPLLAVAVGALAAAPAVLGADSPLFATIDGGSGAVHGNTQYVLIHEPLGNDTRLVEASAKDGTRERELVLAGWWYFPNTPVGAVSLSHDGKELLLVNRIDKTQFSTSTFLVVDPVRMKEVGRVTPFASTCAAGCGPHEYLVTDALSPDGTRLYAVEYPNVDAGLASPCVAEYAYGLRPYQTLSMKTDEDRDSSDGTAMARTTSADGRWVYTLYRRSGPGTLFVQALDTVGAAVHCHDLPMSQGVDGALSLSSDDRTLAVSRSGGPWIDVAVGTWRISRAPATFPWVWLAAGLGGLGLLAAGGSVLWRRRGEEVADHAS